MTLELLFPNFDELIRTPEDVQRLNEAILQLAVQGKLVPQDPNDEPAMELLRRINLQKEQLVEAGLALVTRPLPAVSGKQTPFEIPGNWIWVRLAKIAEVMMGQSPPGSSYNSHGEGVALINGPVEFSEGPFGHTLRTKFTTAPTKMCQLGDLLLCVRGSTTGRTNVAAFDACIGRGVAAIRSYASQEYLNHFILSQRQAIYDLGTGSTFPSVSQDRIRELLVPLPPLAEQHRIVAKVDELFAQTRALEARLRQAREEVVTVNRAALHRLHTAQDEDQGAWRTMRDHFDVLYDDPRNVAELRQAILDLAVRGKLVAQDPSDEPAKELLKRIEVEKGRLVKERLISAEDAANIRLDSTLHVPIAILGEVRSGIQKSNSREPRDNPRRYITVAHVQRNRIDLSDPRYFEVSDDELEKWRLVSGDVLVIEGNGSSEHIGRAALFLGEIEDCVHQNHVIRVRPNQAFILPQYLSLYLNSPPGRDQIFERSRTTSGLYNLSVGRIKTIVVPLPALSQQKRIVAKVDQLMRLCDALEAGLAQSESARRKLAAAVLA